MKKIFAMLITFLIAAGQLVSAAELTDSKAYFDISSFGIMVGDEEGNMNLDQPVTRAEFAAVISRLMHYGDLSGMGAEAQKHFRDVKAEDWFADYVELLYGLHIMHGISENEFAPQSSVTYEQAVKTVVLVLGYERRAEDEGGYPNGYLAVGNLLRLNQDVDLSDGFTRGSLMQLLYNSLDVPMPTYKNKEPMTLRDLHTLGIEGVYKQRGIVSANYETWLSAPNSTLDADEVEIDDVVYKSGNSGIAAYLGQQVEFYATASEDGAEDTIISVRPLSANTVTELEQKAITNISLSEIEYDDGDKSYEIDIQGAKLVKNGRVVLGYTEKDLSTERGTFRLIDNDGDQVADIVFIDDYENVRVKSVKAEVIEFAEGFTFRGSRYLTVDPEDDDRLYSIQDREGTLIETSDIAEGCVLSISSDASGTLYRLRTSEQTETGVVTEVSSDGIYIEGQLFPTYQSSAFTALPGDSVKIYLDYKGYVADVEEGELNNSYAYLVAVERQKGIADSFNLRMVIGSQVVFSYDENVDNPDSTDMIPIVQCQNQAVKVLEAAANIRVNGTKIGSNASRLVPGLYSYSLNSEGQVSSLRSLQNDGGGTGMKYNTYDKAFWLDSLQPVPIDEQSVVICLPKQDRGNGEGDAAYAARLASTSEEDYMVPLEISNKESNASFDVFGYDFDQAKKTMRIVVFYETMKAENVVTVNTDSSPIAMVEKIKYSMDEESNVVPTATLVTESGAADYRLADVVPGRNEGLRRLKPGDLIYYEIGLSGKLDDANVIYSFQDGLEAFAKNSGTTSYQVAGAVTEVVYDEIEATSGNRSTIVSVDTPGGEIPVTVYQRNTPQMFIYDSHRNKVTVASMHDLVPGRDELFYALIPLGGKANALVIYR